MLIMHTFATNRNMIWLPQICISLLGRKDKFFYRFECNMKISRTRCVQFQRCLM